jgi:hypothetical protein
MTTQEKTAAIQKIVANHQDNLAAIKAAQVPEGDDWVFAALGDAARADLVKVFALPPATGPRSAASKRTSR